MASSPPMSGRADDALPKRERIVIPFIGGDLACVVSGSGDPVLLIHSINAAASNAEMDALADRLAARFRVYNLDLPGFGASARPKLRYDVRRFVAAIEAVTAHVLDAERTAEIDAVALSLSCEFLARAAARGPSSYRSLTLISPTGFQAGAERLVEPAGATFERRWLTALLDTPLGPLLYRGFTLPASIRFFLKRTFGRDDVDPHVLQAALAQPKQTGAEHAPLAFISGRLFSRDITTVYRGLTLPVLLLHGLRGAFSDFSADWPNERLNWTVQAHDTGALPQVETPAAVAEDIMAHIAQAARTQASGGLLQPELAHDPPRGL